LALEHNIKSIVHPMIFPGPGNTDATLRGEAPGDYLLRTLKHILDDPYFGGIEVTHIKDRGVRSEAARMLRNSGKLITYSAQPVQLYNEDNLIEETDISSIDSVERRKAVDRIFACMDEASELGASNFALLSGRDPVISGGNEGARGEAMRALSLSLNEICRRARELGMNVVLEIFDRGSEPGYKGQLIGPADDAKAVAETVRNFYGNDNFGLMYDLSHMPLLGEKPDVLRGMADYLSYIHIGNSIAGEGGDGRPTGDSHPRFGVPGSAVDQELLADFLRTLHAIGYRGPIGFEIRPYGDEIPEDIIESAKSFLEEARRRIDVSYVLGQYAFKTRSFAPEKLFDLLTELRVHKGEIIEAEAKRRTRRKGLTGDGKLMILAADHPARFVTSIAEEPVRMGDREEYLGRILRVMMSGEVDGLMATADIIEDVLLINYILRERGLGSFLDNKLLIGSMNRGGLRGALYEMDDRMTAYRSAKRMAEMGLDGAKLMIRLAIPDPYDRYCLQTLEYCAEAIDECNSFGLPVFVEALPVEKSGDRYIVRRNADDIIRTIGVASALGSSSSGMWLKIPYVEGFDRVARSTTLPILILGGESTGNPTGLMEEVERGMGSGGNVRGALCGRNLLYPGMDDPLAVSSAIYRMIHQGISLPEALDVLSKRRGEGISTIAAIL